MRLTLRLTMALTGILLVQFLLYAYVAVQRQGLFLEADMKQDVLQIGRTLSFATAKTWERDGLQNAIDLVAATNGGRKSIGIRFVWISGSPPPLLRPSVPVTKLKGLRSQRPVIVRHDQGGQEILFTYVKIPHEGGESAAIELRESFDPERRFMHLSLVEIGIFLAIVVTSSALLMLLLGYYLVARPIKQLRAQLRRIGKGDFAVPTAIFGKDEVSLLSREINQMSAELTKTRKELETATAEKIATLEQLRHADRLTAVGTLAAGVAHELGTPLNIIEGRAALLAEAMRDRPEAEQHAYWIVDQTRRMTTIVRQLLNVARRRPPQMESSDLRELIVRVVEMVRPYADKRSVRVRCLAGESPIRADVDSSQIQQVLINLLINAVQATGGGEVVTGLNQSDIEPATSGYHSAAKTFYCLYVKDCGRGMNEDQITQAFDPFYTTKEAGEGTGMGLTVARKIVAEHGGWIEVRSSPGEGSCFTVYLPAEAA